MTFSCLNIYIYLFGRLETVMREYLTRAGIIDTGSSTNDTFVRQGTDGLLGSRGRRHIGPVGPPRAQSGPIGPPREISNNIWTVRI